MKKKYLFLGIVIATLIVGFWLRGQFQIDSCLDNGGKWDYERKQCIGVN